MVFLIGDLFLIGSELAMIISISEISGYNWRNQTFLSICIKINRTIHVEKNKHWKNSIWKWQIFVQRILINHFQSDPPPPPFFKFQDLPLIFKMEMIMYTDQQIDNAAHSELFDFTLDDLSVLQQMLQQLLNRVHKPQSLFL